MKKSIPYLVIAALVFLLWFTNCRGTKTVPKKITVPEVIGKFESKTPETITIHDTVEVEKNGSKIHYDPKEKALIQKLLQQNDSLSLAFLKLPPASQKEAYDKAIELTLFSVPFEDSIIKCNVNGISRGVPKSVWVSEYVRKEIDVLLPKEKELLFRVLAGADIGINKELNQASYKINLGAQLKSNDVITGSFQKIGNQEYYLVGCQKALFSIKRK